MTIREEQLYSDIVLWLERYLKENAADAEFIKVVDSHNRFLCNSIKSIFNHIPKELRRKYGRFLPSDYVSWYIKVDIFGIVGIYNALRTIIVEVKSGEITIDHVAQLIGYVKVVKPELAILISPMGISKYLERLLVQHKRLDLLEYEDRIGKKRKIHIVKWNVNKRDIEYIPEPIGGVLYLDLGY